MIYKKWQDEVLHSDRFRWVTKEIGREHYCRDTMISAGIGGGGGGGSDSGDTTDDTSYDDDDAYLKFKEDENKLFSFDAYWSTLTDILSSNIALVFYTLLVLFCVLYLIYYLFVNHAILRLARTRSGYSLVA